MDRYVADLLVTNEAEGAPPIRDGVVDVDDGLVVWSGPAASAPARLDAITHRVVGMLVPGLVDVHCHTPMVLLRGAGEGLPVNRWLEEVMWPREGKLTDEDVRVGMRLGAAELLANGITTSVEMYFHPEAVARAADEVGLRCIVTAPVLEDAQLSRFGSWNSQIEATLELAERWNGHDLIEVGLGPHAAYSLSDECLRAIARVASDSGMLVHIHVAEQRWEDATVRERTGLSAPAYLDSIGLFESRALAAHCVWVSDDDIELLAARDVGVAHCPCSNAKHASGTAPIEKMVAAGIRLGIATDGPASHHRLDLFEEARTAIRLARLESGDAERFSTDRAWWMVTAGAADAIGRSDLGRLTPGCWADMVAIDLRAPAFAPAMPDEDDPIARLVWSGSPEAVRSVWVAGRPVVHHGGILTIDLGSAIAEVTERASRLAR